MAQPTYIARKGADADFAAVTVDSLVVNGVTVEAGSIVLADDESITAGTSSDLVMEWDTASTPDQFLVKPAADDTIFSFGVAAATQKSLDLNWFGNEANGASYLYADASANLIYTVGVDLQFRDADLLVFGSGAGAAGDVTMTWDGSNLVMASVAASSGWTIGAAGKLINPTITGALTVGVDATGHNVQFFGDTTGKSFLWDQAADKLTLAGALDVTGAIQLTGDILVGVDATGHDFKAFGDTTGCSVLWDQSEDQLVITGPADVPALKIAGAGSKSAAAYGATGSAWNDGGTPAFAADQAYWIVDIAGTLYRIPLFANA